jgi:hypothetical protein
MSPDLEHSPDTVTPYVAPRTELERMLAAMWSDVLGVERVGIHDDFFDLGGNSVRSLELVARGAEAGLDFSMTDILAGATVAQIADAIAVEYKPASAPCGSTQRTPGENIRIVSLRPGNRTTAFVLLPALYDLHKVRALTGRLPEVSFHVLVPAWSPARPYVGIPSLSSEIVETIRSLQPKGPYRIVGHCGGGLVAYEAASLLRREGEHVSLLALLDTRHPRAPGERRRLAYTLPMDLEAQDLEPVRAKLDWLEELRASPSASRQELMLHLWAVIRSNMTPLLRFVIDFPPSRWNEDFIDHIARDLMNFVHNCLAAESYLPGPFDARLDLVYGHLDSEAPLPTPSALAAPWEQAGVAMVKVTRATELHTEVLQSSTVVDLLSRSFDAG